LLSINAVDTLAAYVKSEEDITGDQLHEFAERLIQQHPYIKHILYGELTDSSAGTDDLANSLTLKHESYHTTPLIQNKENLTDEGPFKEIINTLFKEIINTLLSDSSISTLSSAVLLADDHFYGFFRLVTDMVGNQSSGLVIVLIDPEEIFAGIPLSDRVQLELYNENAFLGRQLLFRKPAIDAEGKQLRVAELSEQEMIQLPTSSARGYLYRLADWREHHVVALFIDPFKGYSGQGAS